MVRAPRLSNKSLLFHPHVPSVLAAPSLSVPVASDAPRARRKLSDYLDQGDDAMFEPLPEQELRRYRAVFEATTGGPPQEAERPTADQLAALHHKARTGGLYVDFALWGPFGRRMAKHRRFEAMVWIDGALQPRMVRGPSDFESWRAA